MKKLNRKGFTLVELLAVIIILAIVVGISIPSVTSIINGSKNSALGVAVESAADYLQNQYDIYNIDSAGVSAEFAELINLGEKKLTAGTDDGIIKALGFKTENVEEVIVKVVDKAAEGKVDICVTVSKIKKSSEYFVTSHWDLDTKTNIATATSTAKNKAGNACS